LFLHRENIMLQIIVDHRLEIDALCVKWGASRLELFGSAARGDFDPDAVAYQHRKVIYAA
jgi:predicted nucleotidyltransferase